VEWRGREGLLMSRRGISSKFQEHRIYDGRSGAAVNKKNKALNYVN
jgi:hypothetical protein